MKAFQQAKNLAKQLVQQNLRDDHREKMSEAAGDMSKVWKLAKWVKNGDTPLYSFTPLIKPISSDNYVHTPIKTAEVFGSSSFSSPPKTCARQS